MFKEFDRVVLAVDLPDKKLMEGDIGTIVTVYNDGEAFEVEFFTLEGKTLAVETLEKTKIRHVRKNEVAHVREVA